VNDPSASRFRPGPTLRAGAVLAAFLLLFVLIDRFSGPSGDDQPGGTGAASGATTTTVGATTTAPPTTEAPTTTRTAPPTTTTRPTSAEPTGTTRTTPPRTTGLRSADGVTIQILNGTGGLELARDFKPLVRKEGYDVVRTANTNGRYKVSTIFYTPGHTEDAVAFRARFPAFRIVAPAPDSLSKTVALHAVIGENYRP
jgi:hypothetical protein